MKRKYNIIILSFCLVSCTLLNFIFIDFLVDKMPSTTIYGNDNIEQLKNSYYTLTPFLIDERDPTISFIYYRDHYPWCTGTGTEADPYVIDNILIAGGFSSTCLTIGYTYSSTHFTIQNSKFIESGTSNSGILLWGAQNGDIINSIFEDCDLGIVVDSNSQYSYIYNNDIHDCGWGISIENSPNAQVVDNIVLRSINQGIVIESSSYSTVIGNTVTETSGSSFTTIEMGIFAFDSDYLEIINNTANDNNKDGIMIVECNYAEVTGNTVNSNQDHGIHLIGCTHYNIEDNFINYNNLYGIYLNNSDNNVVSGNTAEGNGISGIFEIDNCSGNLITNNFWIENPFIIDETGGGDFTWAEAVNDMYWCSGNGTIDDPYVIKDLTVKGHYLDTCIEIRNSNVYFAINDSKVYNGLVGFKLKNVTNGGISSNTIDNNTRGIYLELSNNSNVMGNTIENSVNGEIWLEYSSDNNITGNNIDSDSNYAIYLEYSDRNKISLNVITGNAHCVYQTHCVNNIIVNNFCNIDIIITINAPTPNQLTGTDAPDFDLSLSILDPNTTWYTLNGGSPATFTGISGTIDQTLWNGEGNGTVTIRFYANNSMNQVGFSEVIVRKDIDGPVVTIISPSPFGVFGSIAPIYNVNIEGVLLDTFWYTIDGGLTNFTFTLFTDHINQTAWDSRPDGIIVIRFYANTTTGNLKYDQVSVRKDTTAPLITINSPSQNDIFRVDAPSYSISIIEPTLVSIWYTLDGGSTNITITETIGTFNQTEWIGRGNGTVTIRFYAIDILDRENYAEVSVRKDIIAPLVLINNPLPNELFGLTPPTFSITIDEPNPGTTCYNLFGDTINYTFTGLTGSISPSAWNFFGNGTVKIIFYAIDAVGNIGFAEVTIRKDIIAPLILINDPLPNELFGHTPPTFDITIDEPNINISWYTIIGLGFDIPLPGLTGSISQSAWNAFGNGNVTIRFYTSDMADNIGFTEVTIRKDIIDPIVSIHEPYPNFLFGDRAPDFKISVEELFLDDIWYKIIGESLNFTFMGDVTADLLETIDQSGWDLFGNETLTIRFYANDTSGNIGFKDVVVKKDIYTDLIFEIFYPATNTQYGIEAPSFRLYISILDISRTTYSLDKGNIVVNFTGFQGEISESLWLTTPNGTVTIRFYVEDTSDNIFYRDVNVIKLGTLPGYRKINPVADFFGFLFLPPNTLITLGSIIGIAAGGFLIIKKEKDPSFSILKKKKGPMK